MRPKTLGELKRAITLRAAGWTLSAIAVDTGLSASTLYRHFKAHSIGRGTLSTEAVEAAKQQLLNDAGFVENLKHTIASAIVDDLAMVKQIREASMLALEELATDTTAPAMIKSRSLAALATTTKITSDVLRRALRMDDGALNEVEELPTLLVARMDEDEIQAIKSRFNDDEDGEESVSGDLALISD